MILSIVTSMGMITFYLYIIYDNFITEETITIFKFIFNIALIFLFMLNIRYWINTHYFHLKHGELKISTGIFQHFTTKIEEIDNVDRKFDEWTIFLKNGKKKTFSDAHIPKEQKSEFKELMNLFPKVHPQVQL